jgi:acyl-CoA dehydrogenase
VDFELPEEVRLVKQTVRDFIDREVIPLERGFRPEGEEMPPELLEPLQTKAKRLGSGTLTSLKSKVGPVSIC